MALTPNPNAFRRLSATASTTLARLAPRERRAVIAAAWVLGLGLVWWLAVAPALDTLFQAGARHARLDAQLSQMQRMATAAEALRGQNTALPPSRDEVLRTLEVATNGLGGTAQLSVLGDRATVTLRNTQPDALAQWLSQVRINARLIPVQSQLSREAGNPGWNGTVVLSGPSLGQGS
ncbi:MAG: type II secretion system protein GspM [Hydrogenophaga sp.]|uniref:type II secretion system protein GspM n=1 Tax=Hydrogenophaga sp. TaxID=1904254 RepID=UPI003D0CA8B0